MAENYQFIAEGHPSIYSEEPKPREFNVFFSTPSAGVNEDTGILLLIAGFGGHSNSKVYKKMRERFADQYNLVTVQCDYFGYEFMQTTNDITIPDANSAEFQKTLRQLLSEEEYERAYVNGKIHTSYVISLLSRMDVQLGVQAIFEENFDNFNDMGIMQAVDNLYAIIRVMGILYDNEYMFNASNITIYGNSHGAYLAYLVNAIAPELVNHILDNSAWVMPAYLTSASYRYEFLNLDKMSLGIKYPYIVQTKIKDYDIYCLSEWYRKFDSKCRIVSYQGVKDMLISAEEKEAFIQLLNHVKFVRIDESMVDGEMIKNDKHGLGADYLKLFSHYYEHERETEACKSTVYSLPDAITMKTEMAEYIFDFEEILPKIIIKSLK